MKTLKIKIMLLMPGCKYNTQFFRQRINNNDIKNIVNTLIIQYKFGMFEYRAVQFNYSLIITYNYSRDSNSSWKILSNTRTPVKIIIHLIINNGSFNWQFNKLYNSLLYLRELCSQVNVNKVNIQVPSPHTDC